MLALADRAWVTDCGERIIVHAATPQLQRRLERLVFVVACTHPGVVGQKCSVRKLKGGCIQKAGVQYGAVSRLHIRGR